MKYFLLFSTAFAVSITSNAQNEFITQASGNYSGAAATWTGSGNSHNPPIDDTDCDCTIIIKAGHTVTMNTTIGLTNAIIILEGAGSQLTFANATNFKINLLGNSAIDIQNTSARIFGTNNANIITLGTSIGTTIYTGGTTMFNSTTPGEVNGIASASSQRANVNFQNSTLPVTLSDFKASVKNNSVSLSWVTDGEINSKQFQVERGSDSKTWGSIGTVNASGNVNVTQNYSFTDVAPLNGDNYYRLKIVDIDAKFEYSPIKNVKIAVASLSMIASPNPATEGTLNIAVSQQVGKDYQVRVINRLGQVLYNQKYPGSTSRISLQVSNYPEGQYFIEATDAAGAKQIRSIIIGRK